MSGSEPPRIAPNSDRKNAASIDDMGPATRAIHLGYDPATHQGALTPPVYMTSTFALETAEEAGEIFAGRQAGYVYGRAKNPTQSLLEQRLASLEGAEAGLATASGMGAITGDYVDIAQIRRHDLG